MTGKTFSQGWWAVVVQNSKLKPDGGEYIAAFDHENLRDAQADRG
jgi:hypothetical protein